MVQLTGFYDVFGRATKSSECAGPANRVTMKSSLSPRRMNPNMWVVEDMPMRLVVVSTLTWALMVSTPRTTGPSAKRAVWINCVQLFRLARPNTMAAGIKNS